MFKPNLLNGLFLGLAGSSAWAQQAILPPAASNHADEIDFTLNFINAVTVIFFMLIIVLMFFFAWRFRRKDVNQKALSQLGHHTVLELSWTLPPFIIVMYIFYLGISGYLQLTTIPDNAYEISVRAKKWSWTFTQPNGSQSPDLHVPANTPVKLLINSEDVLHSVYIPAFRVKKDAVPGRYSSLWFIAKEPTPHADYTLPEGAELDALVTRIVRADFEAAAATGGLKGSVDQELAAKMASMTVDDRKAVARKHFDALASENGYMFYCTEFCGTNHSTMLAKVIVHEEGWRPPAEEEPASANARYGERRFLLRGCGSCHQVQPGGPQLAGPTFAGGVFGKTEKLANGQTVTIDENYLHESITNPMAKVVAGYPPVMPIIPLTQVEVESLIMYIKSLGNGGGAGSAAPAAPAPTQQ